VITVYNRPTVQFWKNKNCKNHAEKSQIAVRTLSAKDSEKMLRIICDVTFIAKALRVVLTRIEYQVLCFQFGKRAIKWLRF